MTRIVASIEARMGSNRLPGKVLADLAGKPALSRMLSRVRKVVGLDDIVVATSTAAADDAIAAWAQTEGAKLYRGSEDDVLMRVVEAHRALRSDVIVKLCGDCPLIDPYVIARAIDRFLIGDVDIVTTTAPQSYPEGLDVEVFGLKSLEEVVASCDDAMVKEHVTSDFYRNTQRWRLANLAAPETLHRPHVRLLLDWPEDLRALRQIYSHFDALPAGEFTTLNVLALIDQNPEMSARAARC